MIKEFFDGFEDCMRELINPYALGVMIGICVIILSAAGGIIWILINVVGVLK